MTLLRPLIILLGLACASVSAARANDTYAFVTEYARELGTFEKIRAIAEVELKEKNSNPFSGCIRNGTRFQLEMNSAITMISRFSFKGEFAELVPNIVAIYREKLGQYDQLVNTCSLMMAPKPGVDYGALAAEAPKITARIEYVDESLFKATPLIFAILIDQKPDSQNHLSHLTITSAERDALVRDIDLSFGDKLTKDSPGYIVGAAAMLKEFLTKKGFQCADEPWK